MASDFPGYPGAPGAPVSFADQWVTALLASNSASSNQPKIYDPFASSYAPAKTINQLAEQAMQVVAGEGEPIPEIYGTARVAARSKSPSPSSALTSASTSVATRSS